ncbi:hypothetical protein [Tabrizicola aquatica]|jgi:hypothetical protein|uniref:hypothetical protein n=1 Tax=Tabrizicola aquatica TaxID=909926 RepID=UPI000CD25EBE|nr:hypothetical protein [Tabrizicola aquatica]
MFRSRLLTAASALFLSALPALSLTLECKVPQSNAGGGYITELYILQYDEAAGQAIVSDGLIMYYNDEQPMKAKVSEDTAKKLVLTWNVQMTNSTGQMTKMQFRASYFKADKTVTIRAVPGGGYANDFEGRGKCKSI